MGSSALVSVLIRIRERTLKNLELLNTSPWCTSYLFTQDLFFISPFYHLVFPFEKYLITDADIQFVYNINLLYDEFDEFGEDKLYAFAKDMSPLYRTLVYRYR